MTWWFTRGRQDSEADALIRNLQREVLRLNERLWRAEAQIKALQDPDDTEFIKAMRAQGMVG